MRPQVKEKSTAERAVNPEAARRLASAVARILEDLPILLEFWDGTRIGVSGPNAAVIRLRSPRALNRLLGARLERAFGRAYTEGLIEIEPLAPVLSVFATAPRARLLRAVPDLLRSAIALGVRPEPRRTSDAEAALRGRRHSPKRDADAIRHHYDLPEEFYALWLDRSLTYSCGYFSSDDEDLETAQQRKLDLVCRKLRLRPGERILDVGCGWGSFVIHAAQHYGVEAVGITLSPAQAEAARRRVEERGLQSRATIRLADYRNDMEETFDAVASIGMVEHVGHRRMDDFARSLYRSVRPGGRMLLHGITRPLGAPGLGSFIDSFVFPDGELESINWRDERMEAAGFELRDGESLREHYVLTLQRWVARLGERWDDAVALAGEERARVWFLYMTASAVAFQVGNVSVYQSLFIRPGKNGRSFLPLQRGDWYDTTRQIDTPAPSFPGKP